LEGRSKSLNLAGKTYPFGGRLNALDYVYLKLFILILSGLHLLPLAGRFNSEDEFIAENFDWQLLTSRCLSSLRLMWSKATRVATTTYSKKLQLIGDGRLMCFCEERDNLKIAGFDEIIV